MGGSKGLVVWYYHLQAGAGELNAALSGATSLCSAAASLFWARAFKFFASAGEGRWLLGLGRIAAVHGRRGVTSNLLQ